MPRKVKVHSDSKREKCDARCMKKQKGAEKDMKWCDIAQSDWCGQHGQLIAASLLFPVHEGQEVREEKRVCQQTTIAVVRISWICCFRSLDPGIAVSISVRQGHNWQVSRRRKNKAHKREAALEHSECNRQCWPGTSHTPKPPRARH